MKHKNSHLLVGYWSRLRRDRELPDQADIDPRAIKRFLSSTVILDCQIPARPFYRLAGTAVCERFGFELTGSSFLAPWEAQSSQWLASLLRRGLHARQPVCLTSVAATADGAMVELETLLAPISSRGVSCRFFGLVQILSSPIALEGRPIVYERLIGSQLVREEDGPGARRVLVPPVDQPVPLRAHPRAPWLRLVVS